MDLNQEALENVKNLQNALATTYNPTATPEQRVLAYQLLENVKENTDHSIMYGFFLARQENESLCRHFGLQLLESTIKYKWLNLSLEAKMLIKDGVMKYMEEGSLNILQEQIFIKDKLSRLVVEMVKREWPQQWPMLLNELHNISLKGSSQTELVLLVFLRLCEDVVTFQNLESNTRRRDIYQAMSTNMENIFTFFLTTLNDHYRAFVQQASAESVLVIQTVLKTITSYSEWVPMERIFMGDNELLKNLYFLIGDDTFKLDACECLLQIVSRRGGKSEDRSSLMSLFHETTMQAVHTSATKSCLAPVTEKEYQFFKSLTQVITALGSQIVSLWDDKPTLETSSDFKLYLQALLYFSKHPSLYVFQYTILTWNQFLKHKKISNNKFLLDVIPDLIGVISRKIVKHGYPYKSNDKSSEFSRLDFDKDADYSLFFCKTRTEAILAVRFAIRVSPRVVYDFALNWFSCLIKENIVSGTDSPFCNLMSPSYLEWDAMSLFLETTISRVISEDDSIATQENGRRLIEECLKFQTKDPLILSTLLTCISGLFPFLKMIPEALRDILNLIFATLTFQQEGQRKENRSRSVKNVRKHAASMLVSLARAAPEILLPAFDHLNETFIKLDDISPMEKCTVREAMIVLSNHFCDYNKQSLYMKSIITPLSEQFLCLREPLSSPSLYMSFIGLDKPPVEPSESDICGQNRSQICCYINDLCAIIKRSEVPSDLNKAKLGGFVDKSSNSVNSPLTPHFLPLLHQIFCFVKVNLELWQPNIMKTLSPGYANAFHLTEYERMNMMGCAVQKLDDPCLDSNKVQEPLERMQYFLMSVHENWCTMLGSCGKTMGRQYYEYPHLLEYILHSIFSNLNQVADWRLRYINKSFVKNFLMNAPPEFDESIVMPLVNHFCPFMLERLSARWQYMAEQIENGHYDESNSESQEAFEDRIIRTCTREYIDVLKCILIEQTDKNGLLDTTNDNMDGEDENGGNLVNNNSSASDKLSLRGEKLLRCDSICQCIFTTLLKSLWWADTNASMKAASILEICIKWLTVDGSQHLSESAVDHIMMSVFRGLNIHGQHEANLTCLLNLGLHVYELMLPIFPNLRMVLCKLPGVTEKVVEGFETFVRNSYNSKMKPSKINKLKKEAFRDVVNGIIGKSRGEDMKMPVHMIDLPPMFKEPRPKQPSFYEGTENSGLIELFAQ